MKKLLLLVTFVTSTAVADWLDEVVALVIAQDSFPSRQAQEIVQKYIKNTKTEIDSLEKKMNNDTEGGFFAGVRGVTYEAQLVAAQTSLKYHETVAKYITELTQNQKDRDAFVKEAKKLNLLEQQLADLQKQFHAKENVTKKARLGAQIAAKKAQAVAQRAYMKAIKPR